MSNFVVSARKYRPMRFDEIAGQEHVSLTLKNALKNDQLAHAFLFTGPRGVGKTTSARILAKAVNCENITEDFEPCNECDSCRSFNENASFNIIELDAASNNSVEHIRTLTEQVRFQPQRGKYKVFIIDEVHMLSAAAFNAFLKTLEEPPSYVIFILATTEKHKILPTILSRCQIFDFRRIQIKDITAFLEKICKNEKIDADKEALHIIAQKADGALRDALSLFDRMVSAIPAPEKGNKKLAYETVITTLNILDFDYYFKLTDALVAEDVASVLVLFNEIMNNGFDGDIVINGLAEHFRNLLVCRDEKTVKLLEVSEKLQERYAQQVQVVPPSFLLSGLNITNDCDINFKQAKNKRLHVELALVKMAFINNVLKNTEKSTPSEKKNLATSKHTVQKAKPAKKENPPEKRPIQDVREPSPPIKKEPAKEPEQQEKKVLKKNTTQSKDYTSSFRLDALDEAVKEEVKKNKVPQEEVSLEAIQNAWDEYANSLPDNNNSLRAIMKQAELRYDKPDLIITVGSELGKNQVVQDFKMMDALREKLHTQDIIPKIEIDTSRNVATEVKRPVSFKERYINMKKEYPLVDKLRKALDLKELRDTDS